jgi:Bacteriophage holin family
MTTKPYNMDRLREILFSGEWAAKAIAAFFVSFFAPIWPFLLGMLAMVIFDEYTGRRAAKKRGEDILDVGRIRTLEKFKIYAAAIIGAAIIDWIFFKLLPFPEVLSHPFTMWVSFQIIRSEYKSVIRNVKLVTNTDINVAELSKTIMDKINPKDEEKK